MPFAIDSCSNLHWMNSLRKRTHVNVREVREKPTIIYEDHRFLVSVLWYAKHVANVLDSPPLLVTFDRHDDAKAPISSVINTLASYRTTPPTERELFSFVEWELSGMDDDWLIAAMELGIVGDVINIGAEDPGNLDGFETTYADRQGVKHSIWQLPHLHSAFGYQGSLSDTHRKGELQPLWSALGWKRERSGWFFEQAAAETTRIVLDFDLDCFAGELSGHLMAWPFDVIHRRLTLASSYEDTCGWSAKAFLDGLEDRVAFRTIALESPYCGGFGESVSILYALDDVLWNSEIQACRSEL